MADELESIARQVMEAMFHSRHRTNVMHSRGASRRKPGEIMVLHCISKNEQSESPGLTVSALSEMLNVTSPTVTQHLNSLETQGLVERSADPNDRRIVRVRLTDQGRAFIRRVNEARLNMFVGLVEHLGIEESKRYAQLTRKVSEYLQKQQELHMQNWLTNGDEVK